VCLRETPVNQRFPNFHIEGGCDPEGADCEPESLSGCNGIEWGLIRSGAQ